MCTDLLLFVLFPGAVVVVVVVVVVIVAAIAFLVSVIDL